MRRAGVRDWAEEVEPCLTMVEPLAELAETRLHVHGADSMHDIELPQTATGIGDSQ